MSNIVIKIKKVTSLFLTKIKLDSLALWFAMRHPETPKYIMVILWLVVAYALSPIDLIPDFIPILGLLDEKVVGIIELGNCILVSLGLNILLYDEIIKAISDRSPKKNYKQASKNDCWLFIVTLDKLLR